LIEFRPLLDVSEVTLHSIITGYISQEKYLVFYSSTPVKTTFSLELVRLAEPYVKHFDSSPEDIQHCQEALWAGWSIGVFEGEDPAGIAIAEPQWWNHTLWIWEFHVVKEQRGKGIGRQLMDRLAARAVQAGLRTMLVETQTTNVPAIIFYRRTGFAIEGVDISYYSNEDYPEGEMAIFMKRRL
jgi:ribosomal protein S18 acetylase RimI-like enzyme